MAKRVIVTITHRTDTINLLAKYLHKQKNSFDEWHVWLNSTDAHILEQIQKINCHIIQPPTSNPLDKLNNLHVFYKEDSIDINSNYLKIDDDIVWMEPNFIDKAFVAREKYQKEYFLIYPNIINNAIISTLHMRFGHIPWNDRCWYGFMDPVGWGNPLFAENLHRLFLRDILNNSYTNWYFDRWNLDDREQVSINSISWTGEDFQRIAPTITGADEFWINNYGPSLLNKRSIILGDMLCVHYAFHPQKSHLDNTNILEEYKKLADSV
jgi:hypothetical protein